MVTLVFCFDRQPHRVYAVRDAYRMKEVLPPPWEAGTPTEECVVTWVGSAALLVPRGGIVPDAACCTMAELLESSHTAEKSGILAALLRRYHRVEQESSHAAELAVVLVPDGISFDCDSDIAAAALVAGFRRCVVLRSSQSFKAAFPDVNTGRNLLAVHAAPGGAHSTFLGTEGRCIHKPLDHVLSGAALRARLHAHAVRALDQARSERFMHEAVKGLEQVWMQAGATSAMSWSEQDRAPLRIPVGSEILGPVDRDLLATLEPDLDLKVEQRNTVSDVYCTGPYAAGTRRVLGLLFPKAEIESDPDSQKLIRASALEVHSKQESRCASSLLVRTTGARFLSGDSDLKISTTLDHSTEEFIDARFTFQPRTTKTLLVQSEGKAPVTLCELTARPVDERRGWAYFAVRILNDDARLFSCEVEVGRRGLIHIVILDKESGRVRTIDYEHIRRVRTP